LLLDLSYRPSRLYRGIVAPILVEAPKRAVKFASNEQYTKLYQHLFNIPNVTQQLSIMTGISAGMTEALIVTSFELIKIRMQDKRNTGIYSSSLDCVRKIWHHEGGFVAFFKGIEATLWRHAAWNGAYFGMIHKIRATLPEASVRQFTRIMQSCNHAFSRHPKEHIFVILWPVH
jgi:solute carrier family 25 (mitochondrial 2-oxodicarboxylate transporter), member 21